MSINFYLNGDKRSRTPEATIYCIIRGIVKYKAITLNTKQKIDPKHWSQEKQQAKRSFNYSSELNNYLDRFKDRVNVYLMDIAVKEEKLSFEEIRQGLNDIFNAKKEKDFFENLDEYMNVKAPLYSKGALQKYKTLKNQLLGFEKKTGYKISFKTLDLKFFDLYQQYCIEKLELNNNTFKKYVSFLSTFISWCVEREITSINETAKFKVKGYKTEIITLNEEELSKIEVYDTSEKPYLDKIKDIFLLSIYTGQRFSDISKLRLKDINFDDNVWNLRTQKTKDIIKVPLSDKAIKIIEKYKDLPYFIPTISHQKTNKYLKHLGEYAGINEPITLTSFKGNKRIEETKPKYEFISSHTARRTFVTLSLVRGMKPHIVMEITGHKDFKTLNKYVKIDKKFVKDEMKKYW